MHVKRYLVKTFLERVSECKDPELKPTLDLIGRLFIFDQICAHMGSFRKVFNYSSSIIPSEAFVLK